MKASVGLLSCFGYLQHVLHITGEGFTCRWTLFCSVCLCCFLHVWQRWRLDYTCFNGDSLEVSNWGGWHCKVVWFRVVVLRMWKGCSPDTPSAASGWWSLRQGTWFTAVASSLTKYKRCFLPAAVITFTCQSDFHCITQRPQRAAAGWMFKSLLSSLSDKVLAKSCS